MIFAVLTRDALAVAQEQQPGCRKDITIPRHRLVDLGAFGPSESEGENQ
jgi:hypothetical protein